MIRYKFREEESSVGRVHRPVAEVILKRDGVEVAALMYIDSGADISMVPLEFGKALGFEKKEDDDIYEVRGVSGGSVPYILKEVSLVLNDKRVEIQLAWALVEEGPLLLGRKDVFDKGLGKQNVGVLCPYLLVFPSVLWKLIEKKRFSLGRFSMVFFESLSKIRRRHCRPSQEHQMPGRNQ